MFTQLPIRTEKNRKVEMFANLLKKKYSWILTSKEELVWLLLSFPAGQTWGVSFWQSSKKVTKTFLTGKTSLWPEGKHQMADIHSRFSENSPLFGAEEHFGDITLAISVPHWKLCVCVCVCRGRERGDCVNCVNHGGQDRTMLPLFVNSEKPPPPPHTHTLSRVGHLPPSSPLIICSHRKWPNRSIFSVSSWPAFLQHRTTGPSNYEADAFCHH